MDRVRDILNWIKEHKKASIGIACVLLLIFMFNMAARHEKQKKLEEAKQERESKLKNQVSNQSTTPSSYIEGTDAYLMSMQKNLSRTYGTPPKGFIWDLNGQTISLGDKSKSSEDVLYAYLRAISTLDFATASKYSRDAKVVETYNDFFDKKNTNNADYQQQFLRNMYKQALTSIEVKGVESSAKFVKNKVVYTVSASMLDLTSKDFWYDQKETLFKDMYTYESEEDDSTKLELFLYDYISNYYKSDKAIKKDLTFDITLERYPDIDSGWLVSIDKDVDDAAKYTNGTLVTKYMTEQFRQWVIDKRTGSSTSNSSPTNED